MSNTPSSVSTGWTPPPPSQLNFSNCEATSKWLGSIAQAGLKVEETEGIGYDLSLNVVIPFMRSLVPSTWPARPPTDTDIVAWYIEVWSSSNPFDPELIRAAEQAAAFPQVSCKDELCRALGWEGDPDVSGLGMIISYYIVAGLATVYFIVLIADKLGIAGQYARPRPRPYLGHSRIKRMAENAYAAFYETVDAFLDSALIFAVATLGATIYRHVSFLRRDNKPASAYSFITSYFVSFFTIFTAILLQSLTENLHGHFLRQFLWLAVIVLVITVIILSQLAGRRYVKALSSNEPSQQLAVKLQDYLWALACKVPDSQHHLERASHAGLAILSINGLWWLCYTLTMRIPPRTKARIKTSRVWKAWQLSKPYLRLINCLSTGVLMWTILGLFQRQRHYLGDKVGGTDENHRWTFGQVLALATWAPVVFDWLHIFRYGPDDGPGERSPRRYEAVAANRDATAHKTQMRRKSPSQFVPLSGDGITDNHSENSFRQDGERMLAEA